MISLPDFGEVEIRSSTTVGLLFEYESNFERSPHRAFFRLLRSNLLSDSIDSFSIEDINFLGLLLAEELEIAENYKESFQSGAPPHQAFAQAFKKSDFFEHTQRFRDSFFFSSAAMRAIRKQLEPPLGAIKSIQELVQPSLRNFEALHLFPIMESSFLRQLSEPTSAFAWHRKMLEEQTLFPRNLLPEFSDFRLGAAQYTSLQIASSRISEISQVLPSITRGLRLPHETDRPVLESLSQAVAWSAELSLNTGLYFRPTSRADDTESIEDETKAASEAILHESATSSILYVNATVAEVSELVEREVESRIQPLFERIQTLLSPPRFLDLLQQFAQSVTRNHWETFWIPDKSQMIPSPERFAQTILSIFIEGRVGQIAFVGREVRSGPGFVDVLVSFLGTEHLVEIKIVGGNHSIGWAESGLDQLDEYMTTSGKHRAYLLVFDGRRTQRGRNLERSYDLENGTIEVVTVRIAFD